jgi:aspartyl-tRNA(Asn)/glutamyl-tRNA(Gln) amidotransferase subunit A
MTDLHFMSLQHLSAEISAGRVTSEEIVGAFLDRIAEHDDKLHAFIALYGDEARQAARAADLAIASGHRIGPLHGLPIALKDLVDMEGRVTTGGTKAWADRISPVTATLARRLINAGMIVLGKTHTVEFAFGGWGTNTQMGTPWNPWDLEVARLPGGSSAGSGVAVAAGLAPCAIGTDTGGSVRLPAAYCGITGLKVTVGRISTWGIIPLSQTLDTPGPLVRSVEDAALLYNVMQGADPNDPTTLRRPPDDPIPEMRRGIAGMRLGTLPEAERGFADADQLRAYDAAVDQLANEGAVIVPLTFPRPLESLVGMGGRIMSAEGYANVAEIVDDPSQPLDEDVRPRITAGRDISSKDYLRSLKERESIKQTFAEALDGTDAWLAPTAPTPPIPLEDADQSKTPGHFTRPVNLLDQCGLSVPNGQTSSGLPTSMQIACRGYDEAMALRIGWAWQQMTDWHQKHPVLPG